MYTLNTWDESARILIICSKNLYVDGQMQNEVNPRMEFRCAHSLNTWNESVHILRIHRMNLYTLRILAMHKKSNILENSNPLQNILGYLSKAQSATG
jgi:hypothetical protein